MAVANLSQRLSSNVKSQHVADNALQPFLQPSFDPADYLNTTLPSLASGGSRQEPNRVALPELSTRTQTLLAQLNAQTSQLSNALTQLTDEIIRGGSRLAYEVEILRGETIGLSETLHETLKDDVAKFQNSRDNVDSEEPSLNEPQYIQRLRTLTLVRSRLDSVIKVFGEAMSWPLAPSETTSSFISVTGPEVTAEESRNREEKGKETAQKLRTEIAHLLQSSTSAEEGVSAAIKRLEELENLATVWKGTAEEKAREKFLESLSRTVEEEQKRLARRTDGRRQAGSLAAGVDYRYGGSAGGTQETGYGFINNLKKFKGDIYLD